MLPKRNCQNPNPTLTQPNLTLVWVLHGNDWAHLIAAVHPPYCRSAPHRKLNVHNICCCCCYLPEFDQTLKVGSWDHLGLDKVS